MTHEVLAPIEKDEEPVMAQRQDVTGSIDDILPFEGEINKWVSTTGIPAIEVFLEKIEVAPYIIDGQENGLCMYYRFG